MLNTKIKASQIANLTDARYFAAWEVEWLGFTLDPAAEQWVTVEQVYAMQDWVDGVKIVGEFGQLPTDEVIAIADRLKLKYVEVNAQLELAALNELNSYGYTIFSRLAVDTIENIFDLVKAQSDAVDHFLLECSQNWLTQHETDVRLLCKQYNVLLATSITAESIHHLTEQFQPFGFEIRGGAEEKVGYKSFDELDEVFEAIEILV